MARKQKRRRTQALYEAARKAAGATSIEVEDSSSTDQQEVNDSDLAITIRTLQYLSGQPEQIHSKRYKELRRAIHPLVVEQLKNYDKGVDYMAKVTLHLSKQQWSQALAALQGCHDFQQLPKQGTIQRWVRDVALCPEGSVKIQLLTSVLSVGDASSSTCAVHVPDEESSSLNKHDPRVALLQAQTHADDHLNDNKGSSLPKMDLEILDNWKVPSNDDGDDYCRDDNMTELEEIPLVSKIIYKEEASTRKPPNHYDLLLHATTEPGVIPFCQNVPAVVKHDVPFVSGGFILQNVLTRHECARLMQAATQLGFRPDHPTSLESPTGIDSCEWLVDDSIHSVLYERVQDHLPPTMGSSNHLLHSINRRWRFFRYGQESVYRPHLDGSWPESRMNDNQEYECDTSGKTRSFLTFLIYLNDDFQGGETRFYNSAPGGGGMTARGITPTMGCVMVFPQGNTASILHEGSAVTQGTKYVVRTDVFYSSN
jgi:hypothetical protein